MFNFGSATPSLPTPQTQQSVFSGFASSSPSKSLFSAGKSTDNDSQSQQETAAAISNPSAPEPTHEKSKEPAVARSAQSVFNAGSVNNQSQPQVSGSALFSPRTSEATQTRGANAATFTPTKNLFTFGSSTPSAPDKQTPTPSIFPPLPSTTQQVRSNGSVTSGSPMSIFSPGSASQPKAQTFTQPPPTLNSQTSSDQSPMESMRAAPTSAASSLAAQNPNNGIDLPVELDPSLSLAGRTAKEKVAIFLFHCSQLNPTSIPPHLSSRHREQYIFMYRMHVLDIGYSQYVWMAKDLPSSEQVVKSARYYYWNFKAAIKRLAGANLDDVDPSATEKPFKEDPKKLKRGLEHGEQLITNKRAQLVAVAREKNEMHKLPSFVFPTWKKRAAEDDLDDSEAPAHKKVQLDHASSNVSTHKRRALPWLTSSLISEEVKQSSKDILDQYDLEPSEQTDKPRSSSDGVAKKDFAPQAKSNQANEDQPIFGHLKNNVNAQKANTEARRSLFDRIEMGEDGQPRREASPEASTVPKETQISASASLPRSEDAHSGAQGNAFNPKTFQPQSTSFSQSASSPEDNTWKPDSPITFGGSTVASAGNIFASSSNGFQKPALNGNSQGEEKKSQSHFSTSNGASKPLSSIFGSVGNGVASPLPSNRSNLFAKPAETKEYSQKALPTFFNPNGSKSALSGPSNTFASGSTNTSDDVQRSIFSSSTPTDNQASGTSAPSKNPFSQPAGSAQSPLKTFGSFGSSGNDQVGDTAGSSTATSSSSIFTRPIGTNQNTQQSFFGKSQVNGASVPSNTANSALRSSSSFFGNHAVSDRDTSGTPSTSTDTATNGNAEKTPSVLSNVSGFKPSGNTEPLATANPSSSIFSKSQGALGNTPKPSFSFARSTDVKPSANSTTGPTATSFGNIFAKSGQADGSATKPLFGFTSPSNGRPKEDNEASHDAAVSPKAAAETTEPSEKGPGALFNFSSSTKNDSVGGSTAPSTSIFSNFGTSQRDDESAPKAPIFTFTNTTAGGTPFGEPTPSKEANETTPFSKNIFGYLNPETSQPRQGSLAAAPGSVLSSAATSRATTPGLTTGEESNAESTTGEGDAMPAEEQLDLSNANAGEEKEKILMQVRAKASMFNPEGTETDKNQWITKGLGELKVLRSDENGKTRVLMRADGSGKVLLNTALLPDAKYDTVSAKSVNLAVATEKGVQRYVLLVKKPEDATELAKVLTENK